jgi:hypothetical protein
MNSTPLKSRKPNAEERRPAHTQGLLRLAGLAAAAALLLSFHQVVAQQVREAPLHRAALMNAASPIVAFWCSATAEARARTRCGDGEVPNNLLLPPLPAPHTRSTFLPMHAPASGTQVAARSETPSSRTME